MKRKNAFFQHHLHSDFSMHNENKLTQDGK